MVALRKDVKVGLTIGAIAVSVIGVYAGLSAMAGEKPAEASTATLNTTGADSSARKTDASKSDAGKPVVTDRTASRTDLTARPQTAGGPLVNVNPPSVGGTQANPAEPVAPPAARTDGQDPWAVAFGSGNIQPAVSVQPAPGKGNDAANRASIIQGINGDPQADPAKATASTNDGSGSLSTGTATPTLTHTAPPAVPAGPEKSHTVQPGETFSSISTEYYGDAKYFGAIVTANPQINPNKLKPGTVLKIPAIAKKDSSSDNVDNPVSSTAAVDATKRYVVKPGDSLHKIASTLWNDSSMSTKLYDLNKSVIGADPTKLKPGMVLTLPSAPTQKK